MSSMVTKFRVQQRKIIKKNIGIVKKIVKNTKKKTFVFLLIPTVKIDLLVFTSSFTGNTNNLNSSDVLILGVNKELFLKNILYT